MKKILFISAIFYFANVAKAQWAEQNAGFTNKTLGFYEFSIVNENSVWAICYDGIGGLFGSVPILDFTRTIDGGQTWVAGLMGNDETLAFSNISAISETEAWVSMHKFNFSGGGGLYHTTDGGVTWLQSNVGLIFNDASFPNFVHFKDASNGIAGGDFNDGYFEIYTTTNGGASWTRTPESNLPAFITGGGYGWFDGYAAVGNNIWFGTNLGEIYKSTDFGNTWTINTMSPEQETVYEIAFNDDGLHGLSHVRNNTSTKLFTTENGGVTWLQIATNTIPQWKQSRICSIPGTNTFVSTSTNSGSTGGSSFTNDNGVTWTNIESTNSKAACRFLNSTTGWAGGFFNDDPLYAISGGIFKWDNSIVLSTASNYLSDDAFKLYPTPANSNLIIETNETIYGKAATISIYSTDGRMVYNESTPSLKSKELIDINSIADGCYILKISTANGQLNKRFLKN